VQVFTHRKYVFSVYAAASRYIKKINPGGYANARVFTTLSEVKRCALGIYLLCTRPLNWQIFPQGAHSVIIISELNSPAAEQKSSQSHSSGTRSGAV